MLKRWSIDYVICGHYKCQHEDSNINTNEVHRGNVGGVFYPKLNIQNTSWLVIRPNIISPLYHAHHTSYGNYVKPFKIFTVTVLNDPRRINADLLYIKLRRCYAVLEFCESAAPIAQNSSLLICLISRRRGRWDVGAVRRSIKIFPAKKELSEWLLLAHDYSATVYLGSIRRTNYPRRWLYPLFEERVAQYKTGKIRLSSRLPAMNCAHRVLQVWLQGILLGVLGGHSGYVGQWRYLQNGV